MREEGLESWAVEEKEEERGRVGGDLVPPLSVAAAGEREAEAASVLRPLAVAAAASLRGRKE